MPLPQLLPARFEFSCRRCRMLIESGDGMYPESMLDADGVYRDVGGLCEACHALWHIRILRLLRRTTRFLGRWRQIWCRVVGGRRCVILATPSGIRTPGWRWWLAACVCRVRGHVLDGSEWGAPCGGDTIDVWCARCFFFYRELHVSEAVFMRQRIDATAEEAGVIGPNWRAGDN